jgi:catalase
MSGLVPETVQKVAHAAGLGPRESDKLKQLAHDTKDMTPQDRVTTDYGVKQPTQDDWLKIVSEDHTGPLLLEDPFGREKVGLQQHHPHQSMTLTSLDYALRP